MATLREVAARAGVSTATVSRVFSRPEAVSPDTRAKVFTAAEALSFTPNPTARSLALGRTHNLGFLVPDIRNPVFGPAVESAQDRARARGYSLFVAAGEGRSADELDLVRAIARQVDGLVLIAPRMSDTDLEDLARVTPVVLVNHTAGDLPAVLLSSDDGMVEAVEHLADAGHTAVTYLGGPEYWLAQRRRRAAFVEACAGRGITGTVLGPLEPDFVVAGRKAAEELVGTGTTAVVAYNDQAAVGLMQGFAEHGLRAGRDYSVVGFDDSWLCEMTSPPLTTVHLAFDEAGVTAIDLLCDVLDGKTTPRAAPVELGTHLVVRSSTVTARLPVG
ncbi:LacI family DNA-binding transcriptional regulator [Rhodococcus aetherivorans]|uniref:Ribose operon repressor n=1 Tax=Rhodococcus aetherivorans TaxID=191292 RepID=A0ABQ0YNJ8_9NOCA|nr:MULTISPECIES: LacI family DNA-binding transcriptional regulator [Rhodococcus]ETT23410.1 transcriptional regulator, LacI family [Rhodococcus rhodochrous ATCC 21198]ANZ27760.1 LacI family transcriptional regulator [Rhodococcus sp. WB1]MDV6292965.1 LacI family DNA-binding transcriptional regulator [Rhodococcus aetherivorans]NGP25303.1 LacI family transcriptional regulator [Rhodococcus aetherivorans]WFS11526.1 LacI family DNA-binding transcriptional regulator [Rhodococcus aetherivorans]